MTKKVSKCNNPIFRIKVKTTPTSLEKLVVRRLKTLNSRRRNTSSLKQKSFLRLLHSIFRLTGRGQSKTNGRKSAVTFVNNHLFCYP
jgi:hypothetical protein